MTPTAEELWNDVDFCKKRWLEQFAYMIELEKRSISDARFMELYQSAYAVRKKFYYRYLELNAKQSEESEIEKL